MSDSGPYSDDYDPLDGIAIVGMSGRFPDSPTVAALWQNLLAGRECITRFAPDELEPGDREDMLVRSDPNYVRARGVLSGADEFDEQFFGFTPREAEILDPQQRLFMQSAWEALENAGHDPQRFDGPIGVFAGATTNSYYLQNLLSRSDVTDPLGPMTVLMSNANDYIATRVSYKFDLQGPALNIQNACSTSLVAVCLAVQSLQTYQCDMALAGAVSVRLPQRRGYLHEEGLILAPDGHCRAFDADAAGTVSSNGLGIVVLRRLRDALADGNTIYAVIKGAALNNDGSAKVGFTAPSVDGHAQVISMAQMLGGIDPATISYIEAHGTGTALGDPIEIAGLTQAFRAGGADGNGFCAIGSIKSNIGHLDVAAGVAGLIKTALALHHRTLPASINYASPNPKLDIENTPFFVNAAQRDWPAGPTPRRAGVSSFGLGGTNAHVVLEEAPLPAPTGPPARRQQLLVLSGRDPEALDRAALQLRDHLVQDVTVDLADVAFTLQTGRRRFVRRRSIVCRDRDDAITLLGGGDGTRVRDCTGEADGPGVAFMFPGQGSQHVNMARRLYETEPVFRDVIDGCAEVLQPEIGVDLRTVLYPGESDTESARQRLTQTAITQPALFATEYALAELWRSWGVRPDAMIGHSIGEYVAACLGGTFTRDDALVLVARRARLMQDTPPGSMLAVRAPVDVVAAASTADVSIAAINSANLTVVSGAAEAIAAFAAALDRDGIAHRRLHTSHAYHSPMMEPVVEPFAGIVAATPRRAPESRWISSRTGRPITDEEAVDPYYWARQLREPVQFARGIGELIDDEHALLEVGPGGALATLARQHDRRPATQLITTSLNPGQDWDADVEHLLGAAGQLWAHGVDIDWRGLHGPGRRRRVPLPTYPFRRQRHWVEPVARPEPAGPAPAAEVPAEVPPTDTDTRADALLSRLRALFVDLSGVDPAILTPDANFLELGFDSLLLTQATNALQKQFATKVSVRTLLADAPTLNLLAELLAEHSGPTLSSDSVPSPPDRSPTTSAAVAPTTPATTAFGPYRPPKRGPSGAPTEHQGRHLAAMIERYNRRTAKSKAATQAARAHLADPRTVAGFRQGWKELVYPIVSVGSSGAHLQDVDGNDYVDMTNGFGMILFGHNPEFIRDAVCEQYRAGIEIGPQSLLAGEVAELLCDMVGMERAAFCSTGSEAVMAAIRVARTVSGRDTIVAFAGSYHGVFDEVLVRPTMSGDGRAVPVAPGIPAAMADNILVLEYGTPEALETIRSLAGRLAAVLVEPVQSRCPELQPREFLHELRAVTAQSDTALIFDEMVTGFRAHPGGAQSVFGVRADIATYGKVIGGGLPIGMVAGSAKYLDALDGGDWRYGDDSGPEVGVTFFAGTFVRHPLALAAARAVLDRLRRDGPELQRGLNLRTTELVERLRRVADDAGAPIRITHFSSWFVVSFPPDLPLAPMYYPLMREKGVYISEGRPCFLTLAHDDADLDHIVAAFGATLAQMQDADFLPRRTGTPEAGSPFPLTEGQRELCAATLMGDDANCAYNECFVLTLTGPLDVESLRRALTEVVRRHEALRLSIDLTDESQRVLPAAGGLVELPVTDLAALDEPEREAAIARLVDREMRTPFDLGAAPLWRAELIREAPVRHRLVFTAHHAVVDGWSSAVVFADLGGSYTASRFGVTPMLPQAASFRGFVDQQRSPETMAESDAALEFWMQQYASGVPTFELPLDRARPAVKTYPADRRVLELDSALYQAIRRCAAQQGATPFVMLLAVFEVLVSRLAAVDEFVVGVPIAGQGLQENSHLVAHGVNMVPLRCHVDARQTFAEHLRSACRTFLDAHAHPRLTFGTLVQELGLPRDLSRTPLVSVIFNMDKVAAPIDFGELTVDGIETPKAFYNFDLGLNAIDDGERIVVECDFNADLFDGTTVARWLEQYRLLLEQVTAEPAAELAALSLVSPSERVLLVGEGETPVFTTARATLHDSFTHQAQATPNATALHMDTPTGPITYTYAELDHHADTLATHLRTRGARTGTIIGIRLPRSPQVIIAILAILKTGAAYLPLDPIYPPERATFMLTDAHAHLVLTHRDLADQLDPNTIEHLYLDEPLPPTTTTPPATPATGDDLAYVMYTSGSTGQPKGVRVTHHNVLRLFAATDHWFGFGPTDVWTLFHSYAFDVSVFETWGALLHGGQLIVISQDTSRDPTALHTLLQHHHVTIYCQTPTAFTGLIDADHTQPRATWALRHIIFAGEALHPPPWPPGSSATATSTPN
ncbi:MAG: aminotransferase class III-fold pyridoxal phosphate-dependent enzyme [Mycobacterium sp.]